MGNSAALLAAFPEEAASGRCCSGARQGFSRENSLHDLPFVDQPREPMIIFDWDDTLMCSSEIKAHNNVDPQELKELEDVVLCVLKTAMSLGKTTIVTNANMCWVRATANLFMPSVLDVLQFVEVMSARQTYERKWPNNPHAWKNQAFRDIIGGTKKIAEDLGCVETCISEGGGVNLIVLGDSPAEIQAGHAAAQGHDDIVKTVKFKELPTVKDLLGQLRAVVRSLEQVVAEEKTVNKQLVHGSLSGWSVRDCGAAATLMSLL